MKSSVRNARWVPQLRDLEGVGQRTANRLRRVLRPAPRGLLLRTGPVSRNYGFDRGTPIDRYFIEQFLAAESGSIKGRVLEVKDSVYTRRFGRAVTAAEVLDVDPTNQNATVIADIADAPQIATGRYDCVVLTQVLHLVFDLSAAIAEVHRILKPGGTLLATVPTVCRTSRELADSDYWRLTPVGAGRMFGDAFGIDHVTVRGHGNAVLSAAYLMGVAIEEVPQRLRRRRDELFPLVVTIRATKG